MTRAELEAASKLTAAQMEMASVHLVHTLARVLLECLDLGEQPPDRPDVIPLCGDIPEAVQFWDHGYNTALDTVKQRIEKA